MYQIYSKSLKSNCKSKLHVKTNLNFGHQLPTVNDSLVEKGINCHTDYKGVGRCCTGDESEVNHYTP